MDIKNYTARDVMRKPVIIDGNRTVAHAGILMDKEKTSCLCVLCRGHINGFIKKSEISPFNKKELVEDIMQPCRVSVVSRSDLGFIIRLLNDERLYSVPVMENGKCVGIITCDSLYEDGFIN